MRKMTYKEAATCGKSLRVRVTPEQSEKMQQAWFAAGKTWLNGSTEIHIYQDDYLMLRGVMSRCSHKEEIKEEIIELIDDLPQSDFASQQEVTLWVAQGNKVKSGNYVFGFKDGVMWNFTLGYASNVQFTRPEYYQKHTLIRVNGVEVPAPLESAEGLNEFWISSPYKEERVEHMNKDCYGIWYSSDIKKLIKSQMCYATKEDAIKRAEAMRLFEVVE